MNTSIVVLELPETELDCGITARWFPVAGLINIHAYATDCEGDDIEGDCGCRGNLDIPVGSLINLMANLKSERLKLAR